MKSIEQLNKSHICKSYFILSKKIQIKIIILFLCNLFKAIIEKGLLLLWRHIEFYLVYMDGSENLKGDLFSNECITTFFF